MKTRGIHAYYFTGNLGYFVVAMINRRIVMTIPNKVPIKLCIGRKENRIDNRVDHVIANEEDLHICRYSPRLFITLSKPIPTRANILI